jgi:hypothetical protein
VGKQTHTYHFHMTDEEFVLVSARRVLGRHKTLRDYLLSLVARETQFLAKGPCDDCKFAPVFETLLAVVKPKKRKKGAKRTNGGKKRLGQSALQIPIVGL